MPVGMFICVGSKLHVHRDNGYLPRRTHGNSLISLDEWKPIKPLDNLSAVTGLLAKV